jgi:hypothetical protein
VTNFLAIFLFSGFLYKRLSLHISNRKRFSTIFSTPSGGAPGGSGAQGVGPRGGRAPGGNCSPRGGGAPKCDGAPGGADAPGSGGDEFCGICAFVDGARS